MKCVDGVCKKQNKRLSFVNSDAIVPSECDISDLRNLFSYFQYRAPNIDSVQSPLLSSDIHDKVLAKMLHNNSDYKFYSHNLDSAILLQKHGMSGDHVCNRCKRFVCKYMTNPAKRDTTRKETDLECLLRHLRNSIAHGHVFLHHGGNYITLGFEDQNEKKNITSRIIVNRAELNKWKNVLEEAINSQNQNIEVL